MIFTNGLMILSNGLMIFMSLVRTLFSIVTNDTTTDSNYHCQFGHLRENRDFHHMRIRR